MQNPDQTEQEKRFKYMNLSGLCGNLAIEEYSASGTESCLPKTSSGRSVRSCLKFSS